MLLAIAVASPNVLANLGLTTLFGGVGDWGLVWRGLISASAGTALLAGLLLLLRRFMGWGRILSPFEFTLVLFPTFTGLWVSIKRALFASNGADFLAVAEPFLVSLLFPLMLFGMGALLLRPFPALTRIRRTSNKPFLLTFLVANLAGSVGWAILLWVLALAGLWKAGILWALVSVMSLVGVFVLFRSLRRHEEPVGEASPVDPSPNLPERLLPFFVLVILFCVFQLAWLPPDDSDELRYHLSIPKRYVEAGGWVEIPDQAFSHFPLGMEMLFAVPLSLDSFRDSERRLGLVSGGKFVHAWFFLLCLLLLLIWSREVEEGGEGRSPTGSVSMQSMWIFLTIPFAPVLSAWAFVDFGSAFGWLCSAFFAWMYCSGSAERSAWIWLAGLALGWSLVVKYTSIAWIAIFVVVWIAWILIGHRWRETRTLIPILILPPLLASPWLAANWVQVGNPVFPLLTPLFGSGFDPVQKGFYDWHAGMKGGLNQFPSLSVVEKAIDLITLPFRAALFPHQFEYNPIGGLIPALLPAFLFGVWKRRKDLSGIAIFCLLLFLLWGLTYRDPRFAIPLWALLALGIGVGLNEILWASGSGKAWPRGPRTILILVFLYWGVGQCDEVFRRKALFSRWIDLRESPETYLTHRLPLHPTIREVERLRNNHQTKPTLLLLGQEQSYYFDSPVRGTDYFDGPWLAECARESSDLEEMSRRIRERGIEWVLVNRDVLEVNTFNVVRGALFCMDEAVGEKELDRIRREEADGPSEECISRILTNANQSATFRRMHAWLIRHPGFEEVRLESVKDKSRPVSPHYQDWLRWPELSGVSVDRLPRGNVSLLVPQ